MLLSLSIENIALIDKLEIDFRKGLNVLSGETGAGKSIIIDSISFVLGQRADKSLIRYGEKQARVTACFCVKNNKNIEELLEEAGIEFDEEIILDRIMSADKNVCRINGLRVPLNILKTVAASLADIYGQHESVSILDETKHLFYIDSFGDETINSIKSKQKELYAEYKKVLSRINELGKLSDLSGTLDMLSYQINELSGADIHAGEEEELILKSRRYNNEEVILTALSYCKSALSDSDNDCESTIKSCVNQLARISEYDSRIDELCDRLNNVKIELNDISSTLTDIQDCNQFDAQDATYTEERLALVRRLTKKYGVSDDEIEEKLNDLKEKYDFYSGSEELYAQLEIDKEKLERELIKNTNLLTKERKIYAEKLSQAIVNELKLLGMKATQFYVDFTSTLNLEKLESCLSENGGDDVCFMFSANAGQPAKHLSKVISGGELSRFMLAVKKIFADVDNIDTMIFDEIDTGISGKTAQVVAEKLVEISRDRQVLAITHLPQLASMSDYHYLIVKDGNENSSHTSLIKLEREEKLEEVARLIGGKDYSNHSILLAKEMTEYAENFKKSLK